MRIGSLFSGAGGLDLAALELFDGAGMAWHSEVDPAASKVLAHHWPDVPNLGDIERVGLSYTDEEWAAIKRAQARALSAGREYDMPEPDWSAVEPVDVLTGGFPCQDVSLAGRRAGLTSESRSGLWSHMAAAIDVLRPRYVLIENVRGLLSAQALRGVESRSNGVGDRGVRPVLRALGAVLGDLANLGFDAEWTMLRASDIGFCHHRARVFILAYPADSRDARLQRPQPARRQHLPAGCCGGAVAMLPTPRASDGTKGGPNQRGSSGDLMLPSAVMRLLPTPRTTDANGAGSHGAGGPDLRTAATGLLSTPPARDYRGFPGAGYESKGLCADVLNWGNYAHAIRRQETLLRPAPSPTEPNTKGNPRLSARFAEWMMGWPSGWVTNPVLGISRAHQLKIIGNGVVPAQAAHAFRILFRNAEASFGGAA